MKKENVLNQASQLNDLRDDKLLVTLVRSGVKSATLSMNSCMSHNRIRQEQDHRSD